MSFSTGGAPASVDWAARNQVSLTNTRLMLNTAIATAALAQGKQWELATDEWGATSTGQTYMSDTINYYTSGGATSYANAGGTGNRAGVVAVTASPAPSGGTAAALVNGTTAGGDGLYWAGASGYSLVFDFATAKVINEVKFYLNSAVSHGTCKWQGSSDNVTYIDLGAAFNLGGAGGANTDVTLSANTTAYRYYKLLNTAGASASDWIEEFEFKLRNANTDMILIPPAAVTVTAAPTYVDFRFLYKDDSGSAVLGTDLTVELTGDGGTDWAAATLSTIASYDNQYSMINARADISGAATAGTSLSARIKTLNLKAQRVAAPSIQAE